MECTASGVLASLHEHCDNGTKSSHERRISDTRKTMDGRLWRSRRPRGLRRNYRERGTVNLEEIRGGPDFEGIIGESPRLRAALKRVQLAAPTDSTALMLGETGTGEELIARAIHNRGLRRGCPFVKMNCAAIPSGLLESELFGHERGAFTGAIQRRIGRFELARGGTLFLDEIGDIPLELQPKVLCALQEHEFERLGSAQTTRVDVRVVAATSCDLPQMVAAGEFRSDLYYRINVFPLHMPALRQRPEDIALLARHFVQVLAKRLNKIIENIPVDAMAAIVRYHWPGNVRELQNFIERAVILSPGKVLRPPLEELIQAPERMQQTSSGMVQPGQGPHPKTRTLVDAERDHIVKILGETNWILGGPRGAAIKLGLPRTTLFSKMQRLGIFRAAA